MTCGHDTRLRAALVAHLLGLGTSVATIVGLTPAALALVRVFV
jgi:hypothetical protein